MKKINLLIFSVLACTSFAFAQTVALPVTEDFENENQGPTFCGGAYTMQSTFFTNITSDDIDWTADVGGTGSFNTGPTNPAIDHNPGTSSGHYMYTETSGCSGDTAILESEYMNWQTYNGVNVEFWYHMFGGSMGTMHFGIRQGTNPWNMNYIPSWTDNIDIWQLQGIPVFDPLYVGMDSVQIRVWGLTGSSFTSDMAIDDFTIEPIVARNMAVLEIVNPQFPFCAPQTLPVSAIIENGGTDTISSLDVVLDINGNLDSVALASPMAPGDTALITFSSFNFATAGPYDITVYTANPNGMTDLAPLDDTSRIVGARAALNAGTYTLDPGMAASATNFTSFQEVETQLNEYGICGTVVINVAAGTYSDDLVLGVIDGANDTTTVTIDGGDTSLVTLNSPNIASERATIVLGGTSYLTIKNMTVINSENTTAYDNYVIHFSDTASYNHLDSLRCIGNQGATFNSHVIAASADINNEFAEGHNAFYNTISNCRLEGGDYSIRFEGQFNNHNVGNSFINNVCTNMDDYGIFTDDQDSLLVEGNDISGMRTTSNFIGYGIACFDAMNFKINKNNIVAQLTGIYVTNANNWVQPSMDAEIVNNMMSVNAGSGLWLTRARRVNVWHNSIVSSSTDQFDGGIFFDDGFGTPSSDSLDFRNNIISTSGTWVIHTDVNDSVFTKMDNNDYHYTGTANAFDIQGTTYADLLAYQTASPNFNANSLDLDPLFASATDLHVVGTNVNDEGDNSVGVTDDIDGDMRPIAGATDVDMGADEFDPPTCPPPFNLHVDYLDNDSVIIAWSGNGIGSFQWSIVPSGGAAGTGIVGFSPAGDSTAGTSGLVGNTMYDFYVREICARGDSSLWIQGMFTTFCDPFTAPYITGFESFATNQNADCWSDYNNYDQINANVWVRAFFGVNGPRTGVNALHIYPWFGYAALTDTMVAITPQFSDITAGDKRVVFWSSVDDLAVQMEVGTMNHPDSLGMSPLDTVTYNIVDVYQEVIVNLDSLNGYNGTDEYVYMRHTLPAVGTFDYIRIDDFVYEDIPSCPKPQNLNTINVTLTSAQLSWTSAVGTYQYEVVPAGAGQGTGTIVTTTSNPATVTGLTSGTEYDYWVRVICAPGDTSQWSAMDNFGTSFSAPFLEDFQAFATGNIGPTFPNGWTNSGIALPRWETEDATGVNKNSLNTGPFYDNTTFGVNGGIYMYLETSGGFGLSGDLISPPIFLDSTQNSMRGEFYYHMFGATMGTLEVLIDTNGVQNSVFSISGQQQTAGGDPWTQQTFNVAGYAGKSIQIIFRGTSTTGFTSDMSIDDVRLFVPASLDGALTDIITPTTGCGLGAADSVTVEITNVGTGNISNFPVSYVFNGGSTITDTVFATLTPGGIINHTFDTTVDLSTAGLYTLETWVDIPMDGDSLNDTLSTSINSIPIIGGYPYNESFETGTAGWNAGGITTFAHGVPAGGTINTASNGVQAWVTNLTGLYNNGEAGWVESPCFDFATMTSPIIEMDVWWNSEFSWDGAVLQSSIDGGTTWQIVGAFGDPNNWYTDNTINGLASLEPSQEGWSGRNSSNNGSGGWVRAKHDLTGLGGVNGVILRVAFGSDGSVTDEGFGFDNVSIYETPAHDVGVIDIISPVTDAYLTLTDSVRIDLANFGTDSATNFTVNYSLNGAPAVTDTIAFLAAGDTVQYTFAVPVPLPLPGGISTLDVYTAWANDSIFGNDSITNHVFENLLKTIPYFEDFETFGNQTNGINFRGWSNANGGVTPDWSTGMNTPSFGTGPVEDHTIGAGGTFAYLETSGGFNGQDTLRSAIVLVPPTMPNIEMTYWYHMFGPAMGTLEVWADTGSALVFLDSLVGFQDTLQLDPWDSSTVQMMGFANTALQLVFVGKSGTTFTSDMSIDDVSIDSSIVTSIVTNISETSSFSVYPNPSNGVFTLDITVEKSENFNLSVRDVRGQLVHQDLLTVSGTRSEQLDFSGLAKGVYFLQLQTGEATRVEKLIIR